MIGPGSNLGQVTEGQADFAQGLGRPSQSRLKPLIWNGLWRFLVYLRVLSGLCFGDFRRTLPTKDMKVHEGRPNPFSPALPGPSSPARRRLHTCFAEIRAGQFAEKQPYERRRTS